MAFASKQRGKPAETDIFDMVIEISWILSFRAAPPSRGACRQGDDASPIVARSLGIGAGRGGAVPSGIHRRSAAKAGTRSDPPDPYPDGTWGGLPDRKSGV